MTFPKAIYACDIGSVRSGAFAWARVVSHGGGPVASFDIEGLVHSLRHDLNEGLSVALGFEAPLFMPVPVSAGSLSTGRIGEGNRSMFAPAGASVATLAIHEAAWILGSVREGLRSDVKYTLDWREWMPTNDIQKLLVWEAFVSGPAHGSHEQGAATAALYFRGNEMALGDANAVSTERPLNSIHAAALWSGWACDLERLHESCLVLRPDRAYLGPIALG